MKTIEHYKEQLMVELEHWVEKNDPAHQWNHFDEVYETGVHLNESLNLGYPKEAILLVAYVHDLFAWDRPVHHVLSKAWLTQGPRTPVVQDLLEESVLKWPTDYEDVNNILGQACLQHRASFRGVFSHEFCELMNSADYEKPNGLFKLLERAYRYSLGQGLDEYKALTTALDHMKEKFGRDGYAKYPKMYTSVFKEELEDIYLAIDKIPDEYTEGFLKFMKHMIYR